MLKIFVAFSAIPKSLTRKNFEGENTTTPTEYMQTKEPLPKHARRRRKPLIIKRGCR